MSWNLVENLQMANEASHIISSFSVSATDLPRDPGTELHWLRPNSLLQVFQLARLAWRISYAMWQNKMFKTKDT